MIRRFSVMLALVLAAVVSCGDPIGSNDGELTIVVDKTQIESDGKDAAVFKIMRGSVEVSTEDEMGSVFFKNVADGTRLPRYSKSFTSIADGEYEFVGIYNGEETVNSVKIKSVNRADYEVYHRNVAVFKLTGTWCVNCPRMTSALHSLEGDAAEHSIVLACHSEEKGHPFYVPYNGTDLASSIFIQMGESSASYPTNCYDMVSLSTSSSTVTIADEIMQRRISSPANVGIKISSVRLDGNTMKVSASVKASAAGTYDMVCALVADNLKYEGGYTDNDEDLYSNVVLAVSGDNFLTYRSASVFDLAKDAEYSRDFEFTFDNAPSESVLKNMRAVILVHKKNADGTSEVNNCAECSYGKTQDYQYN